MFPVPDVDNPSMDAVISSLVKRSLVVAAGNPSFDRVIASEVIIDRTPPAVSASFSGQNSIPFTINGFSVDGDSIRKIRQEIRAMMSYLDISKYENYYLTSFINPYIVGNPVYNHTGQNTVLNSPSLYDSYQYAIKTQLENGEFGIKLLFDFLQESNRGFAGLRLDHSGTTLSVVHYGVDEKPELRTGNEKKDEPFISGHVLNYTYKELAELLKKTSYLKTVEKIGINEASSDQEIAFQLSRFKATERFVGHDFEVNSRLLSQEKAMAEDEKILVTYKGISLTYDTKSYESTSITKNKYYSEKYNINNFGLKVDDHEITKINRKQISDFFEKIKQSDGRILLTGYGIVGFGDLVNFQMLYHAMVAIHPEMKNRIDAYAHFYRYSISNAVIEKLLDPDIMIVTHNNANRQWDPNYSYKLVQEAIKYTVKPTFEIQYNVGSVFQSVDKGHILRVGEIGGMAGVTGVDDAYFTGLSRGGVGFGVPEEKSYEGHPSIISLVQNIYQAVTGNTVEDQEIGKVIRDRFGLMMARANSRVINQKPYYSYEPDDIREGLNLSVGKRILARIIKAMIIQSVVKEPIIIVTSKVHILIKQAEKIGLQITEKGRLNGYKLYQARVDGYQGYLVEGFFDNKFINTVMKHSDMPIVFSGEGALSEGLSFLSKGFMVPFYDFQITTLIESSGIESHEVLGESDFVLDDSEFEENKTIKIYINNSSIQSLQQYNCVKITMTNEDPQLYLIIGRDDQQVTLKKLDRTDLSFELTYSSSLTPGPRKLSILVYKLKGWAKEWLKVIYDRHVNDVDLNKLGQQAPSLLQSQKNAGGSWFNLL